MVDRAEGIGVTHWVLTYDSFVPEQEKLREALCTLGNGYFCTRGALSSATADEVHYPGTYLAGGYNRLKTEIAGRVIENEDLVNMPNWLPLTFRIDGGEWFQLKAVEIIAYKQQLFIEQGVLQHDIHFRDAHGRESVLRESRFVHMANYHSAAIQLQLEAKNWSGTLEVCSALDGRIENRGVSRYLALNSRHLEPLERGFRNSIMFLKMQTSQSELRVTQAARTTCVTKHRVKNEEETGLVRQLLTLELKQGETVTVEKVITFYTSRDHAITENSWDAVRQLEREPGFEELLTRHIHHWKAIWRQFDVQIVLNPEQISAANSYHPQLILRLHLFHLLQTASQNTTELDVGVPARGWHGEAYRGHIFWDELFIFPTLNFRMPKITLALLKYRYRRLKRAKEAAKELGYRGAMFPWQSSSNGREESQRVHLNPQSGRWIPDKTFIQRHVSSAIAYNAWRYYQVTDDIEFLHTYGAEMILEIARFWASIATYNSELNRYEIKGVMGPDEYHDGYPGKKTAGLNNNAYTNFMAVWVMRRALEILHILPADYLAELYNVLNLKDEEVEKWQDLTKRMRIVFHDGDIISQFEGYEKLKEFPWQEYRSKYGDIQRLDRILEAEEDTPNRYKVSKQADVLMLFYLFSAEELEEIFGELGYPFPKDLIPKNIDYYMAKTSHGSTLSRIVHSWVMTREDRPGSWDLFLRALESDIIDIQEGTTAEGIHLGAMAGTVDLIQRCYTGLDARHDVLWFDPTLTENLKSLHMLIHYRGQSLEVDLTHERLKISSKYSAAKSVQIGFKGTIFDLFAGETKEFAL